jgi:hypothetical protein
MNTLSPFSILKVLSMALSCIKLTLFLLVQTRYNYVRVMVSLLHLWLPVSGTPNIHAPRPRIYAVRTSEFKKKRRNESVRTKFHCLTQRKSLLVKPPATRDLCPSLLLFLLHSRTTKVCPRPIELRNKAEHGDPRSNGGTPCPSHVQQSHGSRHLKCQPERHKRKFNRLKPNGNYMYQPL